jgi:hypothetical protein
MSNPRNLNFFNLTIIISLYKEPSQITDITIHMLKHYPGPSVLNLNTYSLCSFTGTSNLKHLLQRTMYLTFMGPCIVIIFQYISNKMRHYTVYFIWKMLYMFRVVHHPSSGAQTTASTASGICHTVTAICHYRGRGGTGLSVL